ncbi:MAG: class I SAM-dependent methyltransferase [Proteobacteria bacterium]|nr:class I SAM-dependent methyltransferase [Pseudomonadota bacterium]
MQQAMRAALESLGGDEPFAVVMPDGTRHDVGTGSPAFTIRFLNSRALRAVALRGYIGFLAAYFDGDMELDGDLRTALKMALRRQSKGKPRLLNVLDNRRHERTRSNASWAMAKQNAREHYGLGTDFYRLWLDDPYMMYTCAYWREGVTTVEEAQVAKIDHVARKIQLKPTDTYVDVGCGFGGFMFRTHETIGATGVGLNNTTAQVDWLRDEIARRGVGDRLSVREADFRDVDREYDKVVSIGVLEHAGRDQLDEVVAAHAKFLKPGGLGMLHFIGHVGHFETELFIRKWVFPGGWIPSLADVIVAMEKHGLEVLDIENFRRNYALTLDAWAERFDARWETIHALDPRRFDERFRRIWRVYLLGCAEMFRSPAGYTHLFQILFSKGNVTRENFPVSRAYMYA